MNIDTSQVSAAILAGGRSSRMGPKNKALMPLGGKPLVRYVADTLHRIFEEVFLVARSPRGLTDLDCRIVLDRYDHRSSLTGIHAALDGADTPYVFITACDTPFVQPAVIKLLLEQMHSGADVIIPMRDGWYFYPLCALYSTACLPVIETQLDAGKLQTISVLDQLSVAPVPLEAIMPFDPTLRSLFNINTPEDMDTARAMLQVD